MSVKLHPEVSATIVMNVARSMEEAELQASGKSIQELAAEEEAAAEFEIAELFDDTAARPLMTTKALLQHQKTKRNHPSSTENLEPARSPWIWRVSFWAAMRSN